ncbi:hypothetical protein UVI_02041620 [Ustilaginoidea virens]|uniref:Uncharacterized protein n=1 Tax=Ustilaginoidea virens TaxID=1159556 RepID=A0A1B5L862_USTVR|nr:hypothetical protein UVI_02041620 [Ustilaginoidea virens]
MDDPDRFLPFSALSIAVPNVGEWLPEGLLHLHVQDAAAQVRFFYLANIDLARFQINPQYSIVKKFLALEPQEKPRYRAPLEQGSYNGYRPLGSVEILPGLRDNLAFYLTLSNSSRRRSGPSPISYAATCVSEGGVAVNMGDIPQ